MEINEQPQMIEMKDSVKITKNTKGYNYEFKVVSKDGVDMLEQIDYIHDEIEKRIKKWENTNDTGNIS